MTRKKEIEKAAFNYINSDAVSAENMQLAFGDFINGAQWADKTMLDKVCDWLQCMAIDYIQGDITDVKLGSMFADLRKYVENGDD